MMAALARLPARQLNLLLGGVLAVVLALLWTFALRAPLAAVRAQRAELAGFRAPAAAPAQTAQQVAALERAVATLAGALGEPADGGGAGALQLRLIGEVDHTAGRHGVLLHSAAPGPERSVGSFSEVAIDIEAAGSYPALLAWLGELEAGPGALSVVSFELHAGEGARQRIIKTRLAAYLPPKEQP